MYRHISLAALLLAVSNVAQAGLQAENKPRPGPPDACRLMPQSDLEALFPGRPIREDGRIVMQYFDQRYTHRCRYLVQLPSPTALHDIAKTVSLEILNCGSSHDPATLMGMFYSAREAGKNHRAGNVRPIFDVGSEAFQEISERSVYVRVRKDDLLFSVSLEQYSAQTSYNAIALARQAAMRWQAGIGVVEAPTPIPANSTVEIPPDPRDSMTAPVDRWPDACGLLTQDAVDTVFSGFDVGQPRKTMGSITHYARAAWVEAIPNPVECSYDARPRGATIEPDAIVTTAGVRVVDLGVTREAAMKSFLIARTIGGKSTPVAGLGDEASISAGNEVYLRKGLLTLAVRVTGAPREQALQDEARRRVVELARRVAARLP